MSDDVYGHSVEDYDIAVSPTTGRGLCILLKFGRAKRCNWYYPFKSQKLLTYNLSLKYLYIIQQTGHEDTQTYQGEVVILI